MPANLETQLWPQDWTRSVFIPIPKKGNCEECSNYCTISLISHASKVMLKILQTRIQQYMNFQMYKLDLQKAEIKFSTFVRSNSQHLLDHRESKGISEKTSISSSLTMLKLLTVWITTNCRKFLEMGITDHLTCLLRNLCARQKATVRTGHGTMGWFQIGK